MAHVEAVVSTTALWILQGFYDLCLLIVFACVALIKRW